MNQVLAIAVGGAIGAVCRYGVSAACLRWLGGYFAYGTLTVNVLGCFLFGLLFELRTVHSPRWDDLTHLTLTTGFLGALTTFSTFGFETTRFLQNTQHHLAMLNIAGNLLLGLAAVFAGLRLGYWLAS